MTSKIQPPKCLLHPLQVPHKLLMGPGPSNSPSSILSASSQQMLGHMDEDFIKIMDDVKKGIQYAFQTNNKMTFAVSGTGSCAMEAAICNLLEPGDVFLIASSGIWGDRAQNIAERLEVKCIKMEIPPNQIVDLQSLEKNISQTHPDVTFICHGDSSTGILQPLDGVSSILKKYGCLLIVDAVASLGAAPLFMDELGIDVLYSGSQKILNAPPGLSPISFSSQAMDKLKRRKIPVKSFYLDCLLLGNYWKCDNKPMIYHHTAPISLVYALREALSILVLETLQQSCYRHKSCAEILYKKLEEIGLTLFVEESAYRLPSVTTIKIPENVNGPKVIECMRNRYGIDIAGGLGTTAGKVWRIGLMGTNCNKENVSKIVKALSNCINNCNSFSKL